MKIYDTSFLKNQKVVIFGATGFVGAHLVRALLKSEANIVLAVRDSSNIKSYSDIRNRVELKLNQTTFIIWQPEEWMTPMENRRQCFR